MAVRKIFEVFVVIEAVLILTILLIVSGLSGYQFIKAKVEEIQGKTHSSRAQ